MVPRARFSSLIMILLVYGGLLVATPSRRVGQANHTHTRETTERHATCLPR